MDETLERGEGLGFALELSLFLNRGRSQRGTHMMPVLGEEHAVIGGDFDQAETRKAHQASHARSLAAVEQLGEGAPIRLELGEKRSAKVHQRAPRFA